MISIDILLVFFLVSAALALSPGPDNLFVLAQSAIHGPRAGLLITLGLCTGLIVHTSAVALGVAALFLASPYAFTVLRIIGAIYLLYLAWQSFRTVNNKFEAAGLPAFGPRRLYVRGIIMNITNPKVSVFFLAFLPQFADPASGSLSIQLFLLGLVFILAALLVFAGISAVAGSLGNWLKQTPHAQQWLHRLAGVIFIGLAIKLLAGVR